MSLRTLRAVAADCPALMPLPVSALLDYDFHLCDNSCDPATCAVAAAGLREMEARYVGE